jgi:hypothetical protein
VDIQHGKYHGEQEYEQEYRPVQTEEALLPENEHVWHVEQCQHKSGAYGIKKYCL